MATPFEELLGRVFDEGRDYLSASLTPEQYDQLRSAFVFHMTDWLGDLERLHAMRLSPETWTDEAARSCVTGFLYHVVPHLKAAARILLDDVGDAFAGDEIDQILAKLAETDATGRSVKDSGRPSLGRL